MQSCHKCGKQLKSYFDRYCQKHKKYADESRVILVHEGYKDEGAGTVEPQKWSYVIYRGEKIDYKKADYQTLMAIADWQEDEWATSD